MTRVDAAGAVNAMARRQPKQRSVESSGASPGAVGRLYPALRLTKPRECGASACCSKTNFGSVPAGLRDNSSILYSSLGKLAVRCKKI